MWKLSSWSICHFGGRRIRLSAFSFYMSTLSSRKSDADVKSHATVAREKDRVLRSRGAYSHVYIFMYICTECKIIKIHEFAEGRFGICCGDPSCKKFTPTQATLRLNLFWKVSNVYTVLNFEHKFQQTLENLKLGQEYSPKSTKIRLWIAFYYEQSEGQCGRGLRRNVQRQIFSQFQFCWRLFIAKESFAVDFIPSGLWMLMFFSKTPLKKIKKYIYIFYIYFKNQFIKIDRSLL